MPSWNFIDIILIRTILLVCLSQGETVFKKENGGGHQ